VLVDGAASPRSMFQVRTRWRSLCLPPGSHTRWTRAGVRVRFSDFGYDFDPKTREWARCTPNGRHLTPAEERAIVEGDPRPSRLSMHALQGHAANRGSARDRRREASAVHHERA
jgi:hypothetical protein